MGTALGVELGVRCFTKEKLLLPLSIKKLGRTLGREREKEKTQDLLKFALNACLQSRALCLSQEVTQIQQLS